MIGFPIVHTTGTPIALSRMASRMRGLSHEAWTGVWTSVAVDYAVAIRSMDA